MVTRLAIYGGIGTPYGSFAGKVPVVEEELTFSGGYFPKRRRRTDEELRLERIRLGILAPDVPKTITLPPKQRIPREELSREEIAWIEARVRDKVDREIALHLKAIEKRRQQLIALVVILDAA